MNKITEIITYINENILWGFPLIIIILLTGILLSIKTKFIQFRKFKSSLNDTIVAFLKGKKKKNDNEKSGISQFEAFSAAISGTIGTGNIVGVTSAIIAGGPGAVFWMWVSAFFGLVTSYSEKVLGLYYREKNDKNEFVGGPMYYMKNGLHNKTLAIIFSIFCFLAGIGMGMVQSNSISTTIETMFIKDEQVAKIVGIICGLVLVIITTIIVFGGIKRIGKVASYLVPFMALLFIVMSLIIIGINIIYVPKVFLMIFTNAFSLKALGGGAFGYVISKAMRYGFARGVFSNEAGLGSSVIAHAASESQEPVSHGFWGIFEVFLVTFVICTLTSLSLLSVTTSKSLFDFTEINANTSLIAAQVSSIAFTETFGLFGKIVFCIILPLFAFTTILSWNYYSEVSAKFLFGTDKKGKIMDTIFKIISISLLFVGSIVSSEFVWQLDDMFNALIAVPNLIALVLLSNKVVEISKNYFGRKKNKQVKPMYSFDEKLNNDFMNGD